MMRTKMNQTASLKKMSHMMDSRMFFCFAALADKQTGTLYTDATGALPVMSLKGNQYYFMAYDYDTNAIFAIPIKKLKDDSIIAAFDEIFTNLTNKGYKSQFNITDNQATTPHTKYLDKEDCKWQFVEPTNHRANAAERASKRSRTI